MSDLSSLSALQPTSSRCSKMPLIRFENITKRFQEKAALQSFNLDIEEGEFFAFLGPSGCGKTTLLRMLAGFEEPTEGKIFLDGADITGRPAYQRSAITMVFQSYALFPHMTVEKNIAFGLQQDRIPNSEIKVRVADAMRMLQIENLAHRKPQNLSGGQQQRVALARAIAKRPRILLLDEPLTALDKKLRAQAQSDLLRLQKTTNATFIIVTHDQEEAMMLATRIAVLDHGSLRQVGTPSEIYETPNSLHVAKFFGDVNLFEGEIKKIDKGICELFCPSLGASLQAVTEKPFALGQKATLLVRPEKITLAPAPEGPPVNSIKVQLKKISYLGSLSYYHCLLPSQEEILVLHSNAAQSFKDHALKGGEDIWIHWSPEECRVLSE